jgi:hypothetical protein
VARVNQEVANMRKLAFTCLAIFVSCIWHSSARASQAYSCEEVYRGSLNDHLVESSYHAAEKYERDWFSIAGNTYGIFKDIKSTAFELIGKFNDAQGIIENPTDTIAIINRLRDRHRKQLLHNENWVKSIDAFKEHMRKSEYYFSTNIQNIIVNSDITKARLLKESESLTELNFGLDEIADSIDKNKIEKLKFNISKYLTAKNIAYVDTLFLAKDSYTLYELVMSSNPDTAALIDATKDVVEGGVGLGLVVVSLKSAALAPKYANAYILGASLFDKFILRPFVWGANNDFIDKGNDAIFYAYSIRDMVRCQIEVIGKHEPDIRDKIQGLALLKTEKNQAFENFRRNVTNEYNSKISITRFVSEQNSPIYIVYQNILSAIEVAQADADIWIDKAYASYNSRKQMKQDHISQLQTMINEQTELDQRIQLQLAKLSGQSAYLLEVDDIRALQWDQSDFSGYFSTGQQLSFCTDTLIGAQNGVSILFREKNTNTAILLQSSSFDATTGCHVFEFNQTGRFSPESLWFYNTETASWTRSSILERNNIQLIGKSRVDRPTPGEDGSGAINDTGAAFCGPGYSRSQAECTATMPQGQDAQYGRDAAAEAKVLVKTGYGNQGFDYHKIANDGSVLEREVILGAAEKDWACTKDNVTGLVWEVKTADSAHYRHNKHRYVWHFSNVALQPKIEGTTSTCGNTLEGNACNTESYLQKINAEKLCGFSDWRLPSVQELQGLVHYGHSAPAIDPEFFPNSMGREPNCCVATWSKDKSAVSGFYFVDFYQGTLYQEYHGADLLIRAVRGESQ